MNARAPLDKDFFAEMCNIDALLDSVKVVTEAAIGEMPLSKSSEQLEQINRVANMLTANVYLLSLASTRVRELID